MGRTLTMIGDMGRTLTMIGDMGRTLTMIGDMGWVALIIFYARDLLTGLRCRCIGHQVLFLACI